MNILLVIDCLGSGGAQRQLVTLAAELRARCHTVYLANYFPELNHFRAEVESAGVTVLDCHKSSRWSFSPVLALRHWAREYNIDVALSFLTTPNLYLIMACRILARVPVIVSERSIFESDRIGPVKRMVYAVYRLANVVTVNSWYQRDAIATRIPELRSSLRCIYNGVDLQRFTPNSVSQVKKGGSVTLLSIGSVASIKNSLGLARALVECRRFGLDVRVSWVGAQVTASEGRLPFEKTCRYLREKGVEHVWRWLGPRSDIPVLLRSADALVHPSFHEGLPNVICEALAAGKIVLAGRVSDHSKLLADGKHGMLFNPADPSDISAAITRFIELEPSQRLAMEQAARVYAEENLSNSRLCDEYEQEFEKLVETR